MGKGIDGLPYEGFDEFYGFLYHLNVLQEPLDNDYPRGDAFKKKFGPRGILHSFATSEYDKNTPDPRFGEIGKQQVTDTGVPDENRFETLDTEFQEKAFEFMKKSAAADKPFFVWLNPSRMHVFTFTPDEYKEKAREHTSYDDPHGAGMIQHDEDMGRVLDWLDTQGLAENTIVVYTTDNGAEHSTYPFGGTTPFRSEKMSTWEGGVRVPFLVRWPGKIKPGTELNGIQTLMDVQYRTCSNVRSHQELARVPTRAEGIVIVARQNGRRNATQPPIVQLTTVTVPQKAPSALATGKQPEHRTKD